MIRIAYICADGGVPIFGHKGASVHIQEVVRALRRTGAEVELFASRLDGDVSPGLEYVPVHRLPSISKGELVARERASVAANDELRGALECAGPFDLVYERYSLWSFAGMEYAQVMGIPGLLEVNAPLIEEQAQHRGLVDRAGAELVATRVFGAATALLAVSDGVARYLQSHPARPGPVHVVPNGVDPDRFQYGVAPACPCEPGAFTVGFLGSLKPWHDLDLLVEACTLLHASDPRIRLLVVGDGPERDRLAASLQALGMTDATYFTGSIAPKDVPAFLASMDAAVAPYSDLEHFYFSPLKVYEYMAAGLPVVASRIGQLAALIHDGVNGLLYPPGDGAALVSALARLQADPHLRIRLGRAGQATVIRSHTWDVVARHILDLGGLGSELISHEGVHRGPALTR